MTSAEWVTAQRAEYVVTLPVRTTFLLTCLGILKNLDVASHNRRVAATAHRLAAQLPLTPAWSKALHQAARYHDVKKYEQSGLTYFSSTMSPAQKEDHVFKVESALHQRHIQLSQDAIQLIESHHPYHRIHLEAEGLLALTPLVIADNLEAYKEPRLFYRSAGSLPTTQWMDVLQQETAKFNPSLPVDRLNLTAEIQRGYASEKRGGLLFPTAIAHAAMQVLAHLNVEL